MGDRNNSDIFEKLKTFEKITKIFLVPQKYLHQLFIENRQLIIDLCLYKGFEVKGLVDYICELWQNYVNDYGAEELEFSDYQEIAARVLAELLIERYTTEEQEKVRKIVDDLKYYLESKSLLSKTII